MGEFIAEKEGGDGVKEAVAVGGAVFKGNKSVRVVTDIVMCDMRGQVGCVTCFMKCKVKIVVECPKVAP